MLNQPKLRKERKRECESYPKQGFQARLENGGREVWPAREEDADMGRENDGEERGSSASSTARCVASEEIGGFEIRVLIERNREEICMWVIDEEMG